MKYGFRGADIQTQNESVVLRPQCEVDPFFSQNAPFSVWRERPASASCSPEHGRIEHRLHRLLSTAVAQSLSWYRNRHHAVLFRCETGKRRRRFSVTGEGFNVGSFQLLRLHGWSGQPSNILLHAQSVDKCERHDRL
jgi:hypothetical protein